jgi:hypothetical protein
MNGSSYHNEKRFAEYETSLDGSKFNSIESLSVATYKHMHQNLIVPIHKDRVLKNKSLKCNKYAVTVQYNHPNSDYFHFISKSDVESSKKIEDNVLTKKKLFQFSAPKNAQTETPVAKSTKTIQAVKMKNFKFNLRIIFRSVFICISCTITSTCTDFF